jgi:hypothetical protein
MDVSAAARRPEPSKAPVGRHDEIWSVSVSKHKGKKRRRGRREPELRIRTGGFRFELDRLPRSSAAWVLAALACVGFAVKVQSALHLLR